MTQVVRPRARSSIFHQPAGRLCLAVCLIAFGLCVCKLDSRPLWWDEGVSIYIAQLVPADLLRATAADVHPLGYYLLLYTWGCLVGWGPFLIRFLSMMPSVAAIALLYPLSRRIAGSRAGRMPQVAMLAAAMLPVTLSLAREARMYSWVMLLAAWSWYTLLRAIASPHKASRWVTYFLMTVLAFYLHYTYGLVFGTQVIYVALVTRSRRSLLRRWALQGAAAVAVLAWVMYVASSLTRAVGVHIAPGGSAIGPLTFLARYAEYAVAGFNSETTWLTVTATVALSALVFAGLVVAARRRALGDWALLTWIIIPISGMWAFGLWYRYEGELTRPVLALTAPALALAASALLGRPVQKVLRVAAVALLGGWVVLTIPTLARYYETLPDPAEDYRPLIAQMRPLARPMDAALTAYVWQDGYLASYAPDLRLTFYRNVYKAKTAPRLLEGILGAHDRLWIVNYLADVHDTYSPLNNWLYHNAACAFDEWYGNTQLALFVRAGEPPITWPAHATFEHGITLDYTLPAASIQSGDVLSLDLRWQAAAPLDRSYKAFVHLRQPSGAPIAQSDSEPAGGFEPTDTWRPGQPVIDRRALLAPLGAQPGVYMLYVGVYDPENQTRLSVLSPSGCDTSDSVCVGRVEITGPARP